MASHYSHMLIFFVINFNYAEGAYGASDSCFHSPDTGVMPGGGEPLPGALGFQHHHTERDAGELARPDGEERQAGAVVPADWGKCLSGKGLQVERLASDVHLASGLRKSARDDVGARRQRR